MRFVLVDPKKADIARIEAIGCVKGTFTQSGQFQVIIGNEVSEFYQEFTALAGIEGVSKDAVKAAAAASRPGSMTKANSTVPKPSSIKTSPPPCSPP